MGQYKKNSLSLTGAVSLGTGVMIGAGIFALLGQVAELSGQWFPYAFLLGAIISGFSAYSYVKMSNAYPSAGGIAMYLKKIYGKSALTASGALLMALSMVINESLVARTFGSYTLQLFDVDDNSVWVPILGVFLLIVAFLINISGNKVIGKASLVMAILKIGGIAIFAIGGLWAAGFSFSEVVPSESLTEYPITNYLGALALSILAYKGFTTITNSGDEIVKPNKNVGRSIVISLLICTVVYLLVAFAVSSNLSINEIIAAKDYSLAEASRPAFGKYGLWFTVGIAIISTISGVIASIFAVSRMTAMLTEKELIPHEHFGMPGRLQKHMLVYTVILAITLTVLFDLTRIASLGAIFYLIMDIGIHWGVFKNLRKDVKANPAVLITAIILDVVVLGAFLWIKVSSDVLVVLVAVLLMVLIFFGEKWFLKRNDSDEKEDFKNDV
ncbi:APC family permease [Muricauda oceani]|jgi:amino acid transporter|uniref:APC family permease n=2 Tax=Flagellimonas TaxID=444459 RepID=A0A371JVR3_9FLAO|nr:MULTISPECIES: APC family permease [Allomuricauda]MBO6534127.1 APC family permease [Allomuricauda sp.]MBO6589724.1 APC family permease [Allomuricauda sp.]MBO6619343.1 APC family permease [Allomuricauda sp.]MBO6645254.1 APC family permease [Allomuricauda sp.]MBO6747470.1 APC family permease [Allomuricauda sp.]|tara:strand:- start:20771 stop:22096 length:1326 start_codon:yes stop_codon:yes gene_type:complete